MSEPGESPKKNSRINLSFDDSLRGYTDGEKLRRLYSDVISGVLTEGPVHRSKSGMELLDPCSNRTISGYGYEVHLPPGGGVVIIEYQTSNTYSHKPPLHPLNEDYHVYNMTFSCIECDDQIPNKIQIISEKITEDKPNSD